MEYQRNTTTSSSTSTTSTTSTTRKSTVIYDQLMEVKEAYLDAMGRSMPQSIAGYVQSELLMGSLDFQDLMYALAETAMAPRPSWRYTMAIVNRLKREAPLPWER